MDVRKQGVKIKHGGTTENRNRKDRSAEGCGKVFGREDWAEVLRISIDIVTTSPFKIDIPSSSESVGLCA